MAASSKSLGRGLESLLSAPPQGLTKPTGSIAIDAIRPGKSQPRANIRKEPLEELAASIKANGVIQPILVRPVPGMDGQYEIVAGERRWQAARLAGLTYIPAVVRDLSDQEAVAAALIENIQREELTPAEEARALQRLSVEFSLTHSQVAEAVGRSRAAVTNLIRLLDLPQEVINLIETRALGMGHARALLGLSSDGERVRVAIVVAERGLSVRETETLVRKTLKPAVPERPAPKAELMVVSDVISRADVHVRLHQGPSGGGRLTVEFKDTFVRDEIMRVLRSLLNT